MNPKKAPSGSTDFVDHARMREMNLALILTCLRENPAISRSRLSEMIGLTKATISSLVKELIERKFVREIGASASAVGRPSIGLELNPEAGMIVGVEIGVDFISAILTDFSAKVLCRRFESVAPELGQQVMLSETCRIVQETLDYAAAALKPVLGIGLGVPGLVDGKNGQLLFAPNLNWRNVQLRQNFEECFSIPVYVDNEANMAALGESYFGAGRGVDSVVYISSGVGIGGGIVFKNQVLQGAHGFAGEIGHMTMDPAGLPCNCGSIGCWETVASQRSVFRRINEAIARGQTTMLFSPSSSASGNGGSSTGWNIQQVVEAARYGDAVCLFALKETARYLGIGMANLVNLLNPQVIVFGGILHQAQEFLLPVMRAEVNRRALQWSTAGLEIRLSSLGADSCVMGGVATVYHHILSQPGINRVEHGTSIFGES